MTTPLSTAQYLAQARRLEQAPPPGLRPVRLAVVGSYTTEFLKPYLLVEGAAKGLLVQPWFCPFGQMEQTVLDPASELYRQRPDFIWLTTALEDLSPLLAQPWPAASPAGLQQEVDLVVARLRHLALAVGQHSSARLLLQNCVPLPTADPPPWGAALRGGRGRAVARLNEQLWQLAEELPRVQLVDLAAFAAETGLLHLHDERLWHYAHTPWSPQQQPALARCLARYLRALAGKPAKCLVLDLDQTLWGGILGEAGPSGVQLGPQYPGNTYLAFHRALLALRQAGILLAICSKNNEAEALALLADHPHSLLRPEHFAAWRINWQDKAENLVALAGELNLGLEAMVFFDDNPAERQRIREALPEVTVLEVPTDPARYVATLFNDGCFDRLQVTDDDLRRADMYNEDKLRQRARDLHGTLESFLASLEMVTELRPATASDLPRLVQLVQRTNQYNLTLQRHSEAALSELLESPDHQVVTLSVRDRFGDLGMVGLAIAARTAPAEWHLDTFLLSCRVIGRRLEHALLGALSERLAQTGARSLTAAYVAGPRNQQMAAALPQLGFAQGDDQRWRLLLPTTSSL